MTDTEGVIIYDYLGRETWIERAVVEPEPELYPDAFQEWEER